MFADEQPEKASKKKPGKVDHGRNIEGQEGLDSDEEENDLSIDKLEKQYMREEDPDDPINMMKFNVKRDAEDGEFTEDGGYIFKKDSEEIHDSWLEGISRKEMREAALAKQYQEETAAKEEVIEVPQKILSLQLLHHLQPGEMPGNVL